MKDHKVKTAPVCPACHEGLDRALNPVGEQGPRPGDLSICAYCRSFLAFTDAMSLRLLSDGEVAALLSGTRSAMNQYRGALSERLS